MVEHGPRVAGSAFGVLEREVRRCPERLQALAELLDPGVIVGGLARARLADPARARLFAAALRSRAHTLAEPSAPGGPGHFALVSDDGFAYEPKAVEKLLRKGEPSGLTLLPAVAERLAALPDFTPEAIEAMVAGFAAERGVKLGVVAQALRTAVTGAGASPPLGQTLVILGRAATLARIARCLRECGAAT